MKLTDRIDSSPAVVLQRYRKIEKLLLQGLTPAQVSDRLEIPLGTVYQARSANFQIKTKLHSPYFLTSTELETVKLASMGYSNHAIAIAQKSPYSFVSWNLEKVYRKIGLTDNRHICKRVTAINMLRKFLNE